MDTKIIARGVLPIEINQVSLVLAIKSYRYGKLKPQVIKPTYKNTIHKIDLWYKDQPCQYLVSDLTKGDFLAYPIPTFALKSRELKWIERTPHTNLIKVVDPYLTKDLVWAMGLYIADGSSNENSIEYTLSPLDDVLRLRSVWKNLGLESHLVDSGTYKKVRVNSRIVAASFRQWFGAFSGEKHIPDFLFGVEPDSLVEGISDGDGTFAKNGYTVLSTSNLLVNQLWQILLSIGEYPYLRNYIRHSGYPNASPAWTVEWRACKQHYTFYWNGYYCTPIKRIEEK